MQPRDARYQGACDCRRLPPQPLALLLIRTNGVCYPLCLIRVDGHRRFVRGVLPVPSKRILFSNGVCYPQCLIGVDGHRGFVYGVLTVPSKRILFNAGSFDIRLEWLFQSGKIFFWIIVFCC